MLISQINMSISLIVLFLALTTIDAQNVCSSNSICINIHNCPDIVSILTSTTPISAEVMQILRNLQCGFENNDPKYCCNQVTTMITTTTTTMTTTVEPESETPDPRDVTNHPNLRLLDHQACGPISQQGVIGGNTTDIFQYSWMAILVYLKRPISDYSCGGTIISSRYVLTSAHCVTIERVIGVRVGGYDLSKERDCIMDNEGLEIVCAEKYQNFSIDVIHPHPEFNRTAMRNDIALIRLNGTVDFRPRNVKPICLPFDTAATLNHKRAVAIGRSLNSERGQELLQVKLPLVTTKKCEKLYRNDSVDVNFWYKHLCAGGQLDVDSCLQSDLGGPLQAAGIYNGGSVRIIQHGVLSYYPYCLESRIPGIYTRVSYYMDWILDTMTD